jgi:hypothetical protein
MAAAIVGAGTDRLVEAVSSRILASDRECSEIALPCAALSETACKRAGDAWINLVTIADARDCLQSCVCRTQAKLINWGEFDCQNHDEAVSINSRETQAPIPWRLPITLVNTPTSNVHTIMNHGAANGHDTRAIQDASWLVKSASSILCCAGAANQRLLPVKLRHAIR